MKVDNKKLKNALRDANLPTEGVPKMIKWLENVVNQESEALHMMNGSSALYIIERKKHNV